MMRTLDIRVSHPYQVLIGRGLLCECARMIRRVATPTRVCVVTDTNVAPLYLQQVLDALREQLGCRACSFTFPAGERSKTLDTVSQIYTLLAQEQFTRSDLLIALGGGVVGDVTGFAAATFLRGIPFVQIPTTLLAQVDSSVGGKTGVDLPCGKNLVGAFWQPSLVLCDPDTLDTLSQEVFIDGMGEVVKYAMLTGEHLLQLLSRDDWDHHLEDIIFACIDAKRALVEEDELDHGRRMLLNFGHTIGHAAELHSGYTLSHGRAVAIGMVAVTAAAVAAGDATPQLLSQLKALCEKHSLPVAYPAADLPMLIRLCDRDKKRTDDQIHLVLVSAPGDCHIRKMPFKVFGEYLTGGVRVGSADHTV